MTIDNTSDTTNDLDNAIIIMQALEALLDELDDSQTATAMQVLAARVTDALARIQFGTAGEAA